MLQGFVVVFRVQFCTPVGIAEGLHDNADCNKRHGKIGPLYGRIFDRQEAEEHPEKGDGAEDQAGRKGTDFIRAGAKEEDLGAEDNDSVNGKHFGKGHGGNSLCGKIQGIVGRGRAGGHADKDDADNKSNMPGIFQSTAAGRNLLLFQGCSFTASAPDFQALFLRGFRDEKSKKNSGYQEDARLQEKCRANACFVADGLNKRGKNNGNKPGSSGSDGQSGAEALIEPAAKKHGRGEHHAIGIGQACDTSGKVVDPKPGACKGKEKK